MSPALASAVAGRYRAAGRWHAGFVRGKLRSDPVYAALLEPGLLPRRGDLLDLGCGRGIALALLRASGRSELRLQGIEISARAAAVARAALGADAAILAGSIEGRELPPADAVLLLDVLHYIPRARGQERVLDAASAALRPGGVLVVREVDASRRAGALAARAGERLASALRGAPLRAFRYRPAATWAMLLEARGLAVEARPMGAGTPFANVLLVARRPAA